MTADHVRYLTEVLQTEPDHTGNYIVSLDKQLRDGGLMEALVESINLYHELSGVYKDSYTMDGRVKIQKSYFSKNKREKDVVIKQFGDQQFCQFAFQNDMGYGTGEGRFDQLRSFTEGKTHLSSLTLKNYNCYIIMRSRIEKWVIEHYRNRMIFIREIYTL